MKEKFLFIIDVNFGKFQCVINSLQGIASFTIKTTSYSSLHSPETMAFLQKKSLSDIIIAGEHRFIEAHYNELKELFISLYDNYADNILFLFSLSDVIESGKSILTKKNSYILNCNPPDITVHLTNFSSFVSKIFYELTLSSRLSDYIVDSFHEIVESEILKNQKKEIEKLNRELDKKNAEIMKGLNLAQRVQSSLIPEYSDIENIDCLNFGFVYSPMESLGGDLFDIIQTRDNEYSVLMADVSGHGVAAALITSMAKVSFTAYSQWGIDPAEICRRVHEEIKTFMGDLYYYMTAFYGTINIETAEFTYSNAGHQPTLLYHKDTGQIEFLNSNGSLIGILDDPSFSTSTIHLKAGDRILLFTDGIVEAKNEKMEMYGKEKLATFALRHCADSAREFVNSLLADVDAFCGTRPQDDDRAVLYIEFTPK